MITDTERIVTLTIPGGSPDLVFDASQRLIEELNTVQGRIALRKEEKGGTGTKGDPVTLGVIVLALISAGITNIKRNPKVVIKVGTVELTADYASAKKLDALKSIAEELSGKSK
jgi:hypothetical protein